MVTAKLFKLTAAGLILLSLCGFDDAARVAAQDQAAAPPQSSSTSVSPRAQNPATSTTPTTISDDLSITGSVTASELRFDVVPNPKVEFPGRPERRTAWEAERQNLPDEVRPGVTYRNIGVRLRITSVFADIDRIVAEALGERPVSDDTAPSRPQSTPPTTSPTTVPRPTQPPTPQQPSGVTP